MVHFFTINAILVALTLPIGNHVSALNSSPIRSGKDIGYSKIAANKSLKKKPFVIGLATSRERKSPLFAVNNVKESDPAMRSIEKKMEILAKEKQKFAAKVGKMEEQIQTMQCKKQKYLEGKQFGFPDDELTFTETAYRSAVKAFAWRIIAGSVTFFTSLRFSGSISYALKIVGSDFFSKAATMFIGERLMNKSKAGRKGGSDDVGRSLAKALIWRVFALINTLTMSFVIARDLSIASKIAGSDAIVKTALMFFYERGWAKVEWQKNYDVGPVI